MRRWRTSSWRLMRRAVTAGMAMMPPSTPESWKGAPLLPILRSFTSGAHFYVTYTINCTVASFSRANGISSIYTSFKQVQPHLYILAGPSRLRLKLWLPSGMRRWRRRNGRCARSRSWRSDSTMARDPAVTVMTMMRTGKMRTRSLSKKKLVRLISHAERIRHDAHSLGISRWGAHSLFYRRCPRT